MEDNEQNKYLHSQNTEKFWLLLLKEWVIFGGFWWGRVKTLAVHCSIHWFLVNLPPPNLSEKHLGFHFSFLYFLTSRFINSGFRDGVMECNKNVLSTWHPKSCSSNSWYTKFKLFNFKNSYLGPSYLGDCSYFLMEQRPFFTYGLNSPTETNKRSRAPLAPLSSLYHWVPFILFQNIIYIKASRGILRKITFFQQAPFLPTVPNV